jgi:hypothetical protein
MLPEVLVQLLQQNPQLALSLMGQQVGSLPSHGLAAPVPEPATQQLPNLPTLPDKGPSAAKQALLQMLPMLAAGGLAGALGGKGAAGAALQSYSTMDLKRQQMKQELEQSNVQRILEVLKLQQSQANAEADRESRERIAGGSQEATREAAKIRAASTNKPSVAEQQWEAYLQSKGVNKETLGTLPPDQLKSLLADYSSIGRAPQSRSQTDLALEASGGNPEKALALLKEPAPVKPLPPEVEDQRMRLNAARAQVDGLSPIQFTRVQSLASQFDASPVVKGYNESSNQYQTVKKVIEGKLGGPGDLAIVYQFMKALDPTSVVRESEYQAAASAGNIFSGAFERFNGYLKPEGGFLPPAVKQAFNKILAEKLATSTKQVRAIYKDFGRRIDKITGRTGTGTEYLTDYTTVLPMAPPEDTATPKVGDTKTFANGTVGRWDGTDWVPVEVPK